MHSVVRNDATLSHLNTKGLFQSGHLCAAFLVDFVDVGV